MNITSILVVTDLSARENIAVQRACQLAHAHRASIKLMYVPARGQPVLPAASSRLANLATQLEEGMQLCVRTAPLKSHQLKDLVAEAQEADLVVLPHRNERSTAAFFRGQPVLSLLRQCSRPVLVVRKAHTAPYGRVLVAVDFSEASKALVELAAEIDPSAELEIFHAISTLDEAKLRSAEAPEQAVRAYRERCLKQARERIVSFSDSFDARRNRVLTVIGRGDPGHQTVIQQQHSGANLVVLGKTRSTVWEDFLRGSVAHYVLSWGSSDVLVVPDAYLKATAFLEPRHAARVVANTPALPLRPAGRRAS
jgi:nucleotide-binding universal stress UspA family protein